MATYESVFVPTKYINPLIPANADCKQNQSYVGGGGSVGGSGGRSRDGVLVTESRSVAPCNSVTKSRGELSLLRFIRYGRVHRDREL